MIDITSMWKRRHNDQVCSPPESSDDEDTDEYYSVTSNNQLTETVKSLHLQEKQETKITE